MLSKLRIAPLVTAVVLAIACDSPHVLAPSRAATTGPRAAQDKSVSVAGTIDVGSLGTPIVTFATDVNDAGVVVGISQFQTDDPALQYPEHAFMLRNGVMTDLTPGVRWSHAQAINLAGDIAGAIEGGAYGVQHPALWRAGALTDLGTLGGTQASATGINASDEVVGWSRIPSGDIHAFAYNDGAMQDLGTLGGRTSIATAVNDAGDVVGVADDASGAQHAVEWHQGVIRDLGALPGDVSSSASDINNQGDVVGRSIGADGSTHAVEWQNFQIAALSPLVAGNAEAAMGINDGGLIIGWTNSADGSAGVMWQNGSPMSLGLPPGTSSATPARISNAGLIAGSANPSAASAPPYPPPYLEGVVWMLSDAPGITGGGRPSTSRGHGPTVPAGGSLPGNAKPRVAQFCLLGPPVTLPQGRWWWTSVYFDGRCPISQGIDALAPNAETMYEITRLKVGESARVCGRLEGDASGIIRGGLPGSDNDKFVTVTAGQVWRIVAYVGWRNPFPGGFGLVLPPTDACNVYNGLFHQYAYGGPWLIERVQ